MAVELIDKIKPKNSGKFALVDAADVEMPNGKRLSESLKGDATGIDLSKFESEGKITETLADGSKVTTSLEFDGNGNPVKITVKDANGKETVTELTW